MMFFDNIEECSYKSNNEFNPNYDFNLYSINSQSNDIEYINNHNSKFFSSEIDCSIFYEESFNNFEDNIKKKENDDKKMKENSTKSTNDKTKNQEDKRIFNIKKINKNLGRKPRNSINKEKSKHNKDSNDNIRAKIKRYLFNNIFIFVNILLNNSENPNLKKLRFKKINTFIINKCKVDDVKNLLNLKVREILSQELSNHHTKTIKNFNKGIIDSIFENLEQEKKLIQVLNKTFKEMLDIYISDKNDDSEENILFKDFKRLKDDIKFLKENGEEQSFIDKYEMTAKNFETIINKIEPRKSRKH